MGDVKRLVQQKRDQEMKRKMAEAKVTEASAKGGVDAVAKAQQELEKARDNERKATNQLDRKLGENRAGWSKDDLGAANEYEKPKEEKPILEIPRRES